MERKVRVAQYGAGKMSIYTMRYVYEKGGEIVAAIDINPNVIGKDIGEVMGTENKGVKVESVENAEKVLKETNPDIVIVTTMSLIKDVEDALTLCAKLGLNAITTCEEAFFPANSNPQITNKLDEMAKKTNCTITGSGYQDIYWGQLISSIAGSTHKITKIKGSSSYNVEDYGIALAQAHGSGLSLEEFDEQVAALDRISDEERNEMINKGEYLPSYMWNVNGWLCAKLGLTVKSQTQKTVPQTYDKDIKSDTLGMVVKAGTATGMSAVVTTETEEGITLETQCIGKVYSTYDKDIKSDTLGMVVKAGTATGMSAVVTTETEEGITLETQCIGKVYSEEDFDKNEWTIEGEPNTTLIINRPSTVELTCASVVNRIPDVINSKAGYVPTEEMGELNYRIKPLNEYVK